MIVAVHQPNYLPWLGYFAKIAQADAFVFLDDVQFSKGSYTNRVQIARNGAPVWLTQPVRHEFGSPIRAVELARPDWARGHADTLKQAYRRSASFAEVWPLLETWLTEASGRLSDINAQLVRSIATRLGIATRFVVSSELHVIADSADERLARIAARIAPGGTYLSGGGGVKYQSEEVFTHAGIKLAYSKFQSTPYPRSGEPFIAGLSIVDALFHLGWEATGRLVRQAV
jgi:hypothetical protein